LRIRKQTENRLRSQAFFIGFQEQTMLYFLSTVKPFQTIAQLPLNRSRELNGTALHNYLQDVIDGCKVLWLTILLMGLWKLMIPSGILGVK